ncbi:unnamed protein product [Symbiodinium sp. CCMP2592]|nr:unnamed protein product [Symbiodinium sp. CCMP2592]
MGLPRPHAEVDLAQLEAKTRALSLFCHPDKRGGDRRAYLFLTTIKEECEKRMKENDTNCYLEQARSRGSNKQTAAGGGAPRGYAAAAGPSPPCSTSRSSFDDPGHDPWHDPPAPPGAAHRERAGPSSPQPSAFRPRADWTVPKETQAYWETSDEYRMIAVCCRKSSFDCLGWAATCTGRGSLCSARSEATTPARVAVASRRDAHLVSVRSRRMSEMLPSWSGSISRLPLLLSLYDSGFINMS